MRQQRELLQLIHIDCGNKIQLMKANICAMMTQEPQSRYLPCTRQLMGRYPYLVSPTHLDNLIFRVGGSLRGRFPPEHAAGARLNGICLPCHGLEGLGLCRDRVFWQVGREGPHRSSASVERERRSGAAYGDEFHNTPALSVPACSVQRMQQETRMRRAKQGRTLRWRTEDKL